MTRPVALKALLRSHERVAKGKVPLRGCQVGGEDATDIQLGTYRVTERGAQLNQFIVSEFAHRQFPQRPARAFMLGKMQQTVSSQLFKTL